eukprot:Rhum_TRINITY_DN10767_c0_g2::Rhum_TRINITY_DN10767_c0_g2_i1::g.40097::m.40097
MGGFVSTIESKIGDLDDVFAFQTTKVVVLKDRVLGLMAIALKIAILLYIIFTVIVDKGYLIVEMPRGTSRMSLQLASSAWVDQDLPYCTNTPKGGPYPFVDEKVMPCAFVDKKLSEVKVPAVGSHFFAPTRLTRSTRDVGACGLGDYNCRKQSTFPVTNETFSGFIAGIDEATLRILHTVEGRGQVKIERSLTEMDGVFKNCNGDVVKKMPQLPEDATTAQRNADTVANRIFKLKDLLAWARPGMHAECGAALSLDQPVSSNNAATLRYDGLILHVMIEYDNTEGDRSNVEYTMSVTALTKADPKYESMTPVTGVGVFDNRHGVHVIVVQTGKLGKFSFARLVISFTAGLGLLALAQTITDLLAKFIMPRKAEYKELIFEYSRDFSEAPPSQSNKGGIDEKELQATSASSAYGKL